MAKRRRTSADRRPEIDAIVGRLNGGQPSDTVCLFIPSETRKKKPVEDQDQWADQALRLFGTLYRGATAFTNLRGVYQPDESTDALFDAPIMVQSLMDRHLLINRSSLVKLSSFCRHMGRKTDQMSIGLIVNDFYIDIAIEH